MSTYDLCIFESILSKINMSCLITLTLTSFLATTIFSDHSCNSSGSYNINGINTTPSSIDKSKLEGNSTSENTSIAYPEETVESFYNLTYQRVMDVPARLPRKKSENVIISHVITGDSPSFIKLVDGIVSVDSSQAELGKKYSITIFSTYSNWSCGTEKIVNFEFNECINPENLGEF